jgi:hypothetical protein
MQLLGWEKNGKIFSPTLAVHSLNRCEIKAPLAVSYVLGFWLPDYPIALPPSVASSPTKIFPTR